MGTSLTILAISPILERSYEMGSFRIHSQSRVLDFSRE